MCTSIIEIARAEGMAKRGDEWFPLSQAVVAYDHARHAPLGDVITLDFINTALDPGARAGIELTLETAKELRAALDRAIAAAEFEEAEVRGKGAKPRSRSVTREISSAALTRRRARGGRKARLDSSHGGYRGRGLWCEGVDRVEPGRRQVTPVAPCEPIASARLQTAQRLEAARSSAVQKRFTTSF